jgi:hypothetical protein
MATVTTPPPNPAATISPFGGDFSVSSVNQRRAPTLVDRSRFVADPLLWKFVEMWISGAKTATREQAREVAPGVVRQIRMKF